MTDENLLTTRMLKLEQRKNRLTQEHAMLNTKLRKMRTKKLISLGGLVSNAKLEEWNANVLYGALLFVKEKEEDVGQIQKWVKKGGEAFGKEKSPS